MLIIEKLQEKEGLSASEIAVADQLLELKEEIKDLTIRELAAKCYTATSSITRVCVKLGFNGYKDFKESYLKEIEYLNSHFEKVDANFPFTKEDNLARVINSVSELYQETAKDTTQLVDYFALIEAVKLLEKAKNTYVLCIGNSIELGKLFADRMMRIGKHVIASESVNEQYYQSYNSNEDDLFIVISYSGTTLKTIQYIENIKRNKSKLIFITSMSDSLYKTYADVVLTMTTREKLYTNITSYTSTISTMILLDFLYSAYFHAHYDYSLQHKREVAIAYEPNRKASTTVMEEE